ncbi:MAG: MFS transporter, partial [Proteobacteria bacterium]|nr:MFS transporter [Pseudomonadota bacterium]
MPSSRQSAVMVLLCACLIVGLAFGVRQSFGLLMRPITLDLGWGRETLSLVFAIQAVLNGFAAPFAGAISDKWGVGRTVAIGCALYGAGLIVMAYSGAPTTMLLGGGLLVGMGVSACGMPVLLGAVGKVAPEEKRSTWLGLVAVGATAGQLAIIPGTQMLISAQGWSFALLALSVCFVLGLPIAYWMGAAADRVVASKPKSNAPVQNLTQALVEARGHSGFILLTIGFFVCGFQVQFVATHLPAFIQDQGFGPQFASNALVTIAGFNMVGAWCAGYLGGRYRKKYLLTWIYLLRAIAIAIFMLAPISEVSILVFCGAIGLIWLGTVPLTSGIVAQVFGPRFMATLFGIVFLSHQLGNFAGVWVGGFVFDTTGGYTAVWW